MERAGVRVIGTVGTRKENKSEPVMGIQSGRGKKARGTGKGRGRVGQDAESKRAFACWRGRRKMRKEGEEHSKVGTVTGSSV